MRPAARTRGERDPVVCIVDDDPAVSQALEFLLRSVRLKASAFADVRQFLSAHDPEQPGCLLLDVRMPGMSGFEFLGRLKEFGVTVPVVMLTGHGDVPMAVEAMKIGAADFLQKPINAQKLIGVVQKALALDAERRAKRNAWRQFSQRLAQLSEREREVVERVAYGMANKSIAAELELSIRTVESHRASAMRKLRVRKAYDLVQMLREQGRPGDT